jgi:hypothetical protein
MTQTEQKVPLHGAPRIWEIVRIRLYSVEKVEYPRRGGATDSWKGAFRLKSCRINSPPCIRAPTPRGQLQTPPLAGQQRFITLGKYNKSSWRLAEVARGLCLPISDLCFISLFL